MRRCRDALESTTRTPVLVSNHPAVRAGGAPAPPTSQLLLVAPKHTGARDVASVGLDSETLAPLAAFRASTQAELLLAVWRVAAPAGDGVEATVRAWQELLRTAHRALADVAVRVRVGAGGEVACPELRHGCRDRPRTHCMNWYTVCGRMLGSTFAH